MKPSKLKTVMSLLIAVALLAGMLSGCLPPQESPTSPTNTTAPTDSTLPGTPWKEWGTWIPPEYWKDGLYATPNDTYYTDSFQWAVDKIQLPDAWDITTGSNTIRVGVIDSGIDASHPELQNRVNRELSQGFIDSVSPLVDPIGHGTHVAGIIGAQGNNSAGISGVCWNVEIVSLRTINDNGDVDMDAVVAAINSANSKGIHILNISLGSNMPEHTEDEEFSAALRTAITNFSGLVVCAAGNNPFYSDPVLWQLSNTDNIPIYPSCILDANGQNLDNVISVGASTNADNMYAASCFGRTSVDLFAPGTSILNCYPTELCCTDTNCDSPNHTDATRSATTHSADGYHSLSGTSMAAPHVAGVAALLLSIHPELTAAELKQAILDSVDIIYDANGNSVFGNLCVSGGRLNAYKALTSSVVHNFGPWTDRDAANHSRTCSTCGYVELGEHSDFWDFFHSRCTACNRTGMIVQPYSKKPAEDCTEDCAGDCVHSCADSDAAVCTDACA